MATTHYFWILTITFTALSVVAEAQNWRGNFETYKAWQSSSCRRCISRYPTYCAIWRYFTCNVRGTKTRCARGWRHDGDNNCRVPICGPGCGSVGECIAPDTCDCKSQATGIYCQTLICSYVRPCYPGYCYDSSKCNCTIGFTKEPTSEYGCLKMDTNNKPYIGKSTAVIEHIRRTDNTSRFLFSFFLDGTDESIEKLIVWSNQRVFNEIHFYFEVTYEAPEVLPGRPIYIHDTNVGITEGRILLRVLDSNNVVHQRQQYDIDCPISNPYIPQLLFNCTLRNEAFKILIEHADTLRVTFEAKNGGFREMTNQGTLMAKEMFLGQTARKNVYFKFDFQAPKHCTEDNVDGYMQTDCTGSTMLKAASEFTKEPITVRWKGWTDDRYGSRMWMYYLELHKLVVEDSTLKLTERDPIGPMSTNQTLHMGQMSYFQTFTPKEPGMYSVLLEVRDIANNSRIARRFILYDNVSDVEFNQKSTNGLHVSSAQKHTGYKWQSNGIEGGNTDIVVDWTGYFMNNAHEGHYYNNEIKTFKPQFEDLEDDGILFTRKFVDSALDDNEGERTLASIPNIHGIVKFEYQYTRNIHDPMPGAYWTNILPLSESTTIKEQMSTGDQLKIWVRAKDVIGNSKTAYTIVTTDFTKPIVSDNDDNKITFMVPNSNDGPFTFSSSLFLEAYDTESGVHELGVNITIKSPGVSDISVIKIVKAHTDNKRNPNQDSSCVQSIHQTTCFLKEQTVYIDNCWLAVSNQALLPSASATVEVIAHNQAMLSRSVSYKIPAITDLDGLVGYEGPKSARVVNVKSNSFRIVWDFPTKMSCYNLQTEIILVLFKQISGIKLANHTLPGSRTYFEVTNLDADTKYTIDFISKIADKKNQPLRLEAKTACAHRKFGYNCSSTCNCFNNTNCISTTGECHIGLCDSGWQGPRCDKVQDGNLIFKIKNQFKTEMSSEAKNSNSTLAVDGLLGPDPEICHCCSITSNAPLSWWLLDLGKQYPLKSIIIYGRNKENWYQQLIGFKLLLNNRNGNKPNTFMYNDSLYTPSENKYEISLENTLTRYIKIEKLGVLTICEVIVMEGNCSEGTFGEECSQNCHCADGKPCNQSHGYCQSPVCRLGWKGKACNESCPTNSFGEGCQEKCYCDKGTCTTDYGECSGKCKHGYHGFHCNIEGSTETEIDHQTYAVVVGGSVAGSVVMIVISVLLSVCIYKHRMKQVKRNQSENYYKYIHRNDAETTYDKVGNSREPQGEIQEIHGSGI